MSYARKIAWFALSWAGSLVAHAESVSLPTDSAYSVNGAVRPSGLPALGGALAGELHFRSGEWVMHGPFTLALSSTSE